MISLETILVPYMVMSAALCILSILLGLVIHSPNHLIEVSLEQKRTKEVASYVTAVVHLIAMLLCAFVNYRKSFRSLRVVNKSDSNVSSQL